MLATSPSSMSFLSPSSTSSSIPPSPRLSIVTSSSSFSSISTSGSDRDTNPLVHLPTPLPSPSIRPSDPGSSKTNAFFGSPFSRPSTPPVLPPPNPRRTSSIHSAEDATPVPENYPSRTDSFFATPIRTLAKIFPGKYKSTSPERDLDDNVLTSSPTSLHVQGLPSLVLDGLPTAGLDIDPAFKLNTEFTPLTPPTEPTPTAPSFHTSLDGLPTLLDPPLSQTLPTLQDPPLSQTLAIPTPPIEPTLTHGTIIRSSPHPSSDPTEKLELELLKPLGQGAFSYVWLARPLQSSSSLLSRSLSKRKDIRRANSHSSVTRRLTGVRPKVVSKGSDGEVRRGGSVYLKAETGNHAVAEHHGHNLDKEGRGRLVAVKMTNRRICEVNDRTRVSFVREVEVLRHISHPSIITYLSSFSTPEHHVLVLEYVGGGELFDVVNDDEKHAHLTESTLWRMWSELCKAVGWMHSVGLVHRDIKLENILLTTPFPFPRDAKQPLIKLSDFGLSRFVDLDNPMLSTRCGSESYAAPEVVLSKPYDGRETDAWAMGVVLYAVACRRLPFDGPMELEREGERGHGHERARTGGRRSWLVRIAKGEYAWPNLPEGDGAGELKGAGLARSQGVRRVVGRLLVRDPAKRAKVADVGGWDEGEFEVAGEGGSESEEIGGEEEEDDDGDNDEGVLVDGDHIDEVAREEVH